MKKLSILVIFLIILNTVCFASDIKVNIDDNYIDFDVAPVMKNDRVLVPMRKIFETFGCELEWLEDSETVIAVKNNLLIALKIGKNKVILNDIEEKTSKAIEIDSPPIIKDGRTLLPVRVISESLGYNIKWDEEKQTVFISTN